jgi:hypothetical protein
LILEFDYTSLDKESYNMMAWRQIVGKSVDPVRKKIVSKDVGMFLVVQNNKIKFRNC